MYRTFLYGHWKIAWEGRPLTAQGELRRTRDGWAAARFDRAGRIHGEVFDLRYDVIARLDQEESPEYGRTIVTLDDGSRAFAYLYRGADFDRLPIIRSGDWQPSRTHG